jgi:thiamine-phosphate pyrophosphorylase
MSPRALDPTLVLVTDPVLCGARELAPVVAAALRGGATVVQLRDKQASTRQLVADALRLRELCHAAGAPLLVNDRVDVALAAAADGVHLGQQDMSLTDARRLLGPEAIIGVSVRTLDEARAAEQGGASYLAANGVWATATKTDFGQPLGLEELAQLVAGSVLPLVAIGGIYAGNAGQVRRVGAAGIAVVSAVMTAADPEAACRELRAAFATGVAGGAR